MSEEIKLKVNVPLFEEKELEIFDNNLHSIIEKYTKLHLEKKEQILTQRIIMKQEEEINKYKIVLDKIKEVIKKDRVYIAGERNLSHEIEKLLEEIE